MQGITDQNYGKNFRGVFENNTKLFKEILLEMEEKS